jgi:hypothetical protein
MAVNAGRGIQMGTRNYGVDDYGLYITAEDFKKYAETNDFDEDYLFFGIGNPYNGAEGECRLVMTDESEAIEMGISFSILPLNKYASLFEKAYESKEEALVELKESYSKYLPKDFDYEGRFVHFIGTIYG